MTELSEDCLSIHIVHQNAPGDLQRLLSSLHAAFLFLGVQTPPCWLRIEIFDDGSTPSVAVQLEELVQREQSLWQGRMRYHRDSVPRGFASAHNECLKRAHKTDFVFLLATHLLPRSDFLYALQNHLRLSPDKPRFFLPLRKLRKKKWLGAKLLRWRLGAKRLALGGPQETDFVSGDALMLATKPFRDSGAWNADYLSPFASFDLSYRLIRGKSWELRPMPDVLVEEQSPPALSQAEIVWLYRDQRRLIESYFQGWPRQSAKFFLLLSILKRIFKEFFAGRWSIAQRLFPLLRELT